jgi:5-methylthioadenosine/S-adenosylhomocysteine deaminase
MEAIMSTPAATSLTADLRIDAGWIMPVEPDCVPLTGHSLLVKDGRIAALLPAEQADHWISSERVHLPGHMLIPGLVNLHTHAAMTLLRGYADDLPLMTWLHDHIWPAENRLVSPAFVRDGTRLACLEMLKCGVTCFNDMYFFSEAVVDAAVEAGIRVAAGIIVVDAPTPYAGDPDDYLQKGMALRDAWNGDSTANARVHFCLAPHAPYTVGDRTLEKIATYAAQLDLPIHMHIHETEHEIRHSIEKYGVWPLARLNGLGLLTPGMIAIHAVHLTGEEVGMLARHGCHVAHCPSSNLKLASGFAPIAELLAAGVNVGIGTDGAASNNRLDLIGELRLAALLGKGVAADPAALPAHQMLRMATLGGARALGLDNLIGSLQVGKMADIVAIDLDHAATQPCYDPVSQLVYSAGSNQVNHVWVGGIAVLRESRCLTLDMQEVIARAHVWRGRISAGRT